MEKVKSQGQHQNEGSLGQRETVHLITHSWVTDHLLQTMLKNAKWHKITLNACLLIQRVIEGAQFSSTGLGICILRSVKSIFSQEIGWVNILDCLMC